MGRIRFQYWRDAIATIYDQDVPPENPVAAEVYRAVRQHRLTRRWIDRTIDAREGDLLEAQPQTFGEVEEYCENTAASMSYLLLESLGVREFPVDQCASRIAKATGLVTLLRGLPYNCSRRKVVLPNLPRPWTLAWGRAGRGICAHTASSSIISNFTACPRGA